MADETTDLPGSYRGRVRELRRVDDPELQGALDELAACGVTVDHFVCVDLARGRRRRKRPPQPERK